MGKKRPGKSLDLSGKWIVAKLPGMRPAYLKLTRDPHVQIEQSGTSQFSGEFEFGAQQGSIDGKVVDVSEDGASLAFTFAGTDEMDETSGRGEAEYDASTDTITGTMYYHESDDMEFVWKRAKK